MKRWLVAALAVILVAAGIYLVLDRQAAGSQDGAGGAGGKDAAESLPEVTAPDTVVAEAEVVPLREASLNFPTGGVIAEILVEEGAQVEAGQLLMRLDARRQQAAVAQAEAELLRAQARLNEVRAGPRPQEVEMARAAVAAAQAQVAKLRAGMARPEDIDAAEAELRRARAELDLLLAGTRPETVAVAEADVAALRAALQQAQVALAETELRAPFAGTVALLEVEVGDYAAPGGEVLRLADLSSWHLETRDLSEVQVAGVHEGQPVRITFDALPDLQATGTVERIQPLGVNKQGDITYKVIIALDQQDPRLRWNMTATVEIRRAP